MIILRQKNYSVGGGIVGGILGDIGGAIVGDKIGSKFKKKVTKSDIDKEKAAIKDNEQFIKYLKNHKKLTDKDIDKLYDREVSGDVSSIIGEYSGDDPDYDDPKHLNRNKQKMIKESEKYIKKHQDNISNPEKLNKTYKDTGRTIGAVIGTVGGAILGHKLTNKKKK